MNALEKKQSINEKKRTTFNACASSSGIKISKDRKEVGSMKDQEETGKNFFFPIRVEFKPDLLLATSLYQKVPGGRICL